MLVVACLVGVVPTSAVRICVHLVRILIERLCTISAPFEGLVRDSATRAIRDVEEPAVATPRRWRRLCFVARRASLGLDGAVLIAERDVVFGAPRLEAGRRRRFVGDVAEPADPLVRGEAVGKQDGRVADRVAFLPQVGFVLDHLVEALGLPRGGDGERRGTGVGASRVGAPLELGCSGIASSFVGLVVPVDAADVDEPLVIPHALNQEARVVLVHPVHAVHEPARIGRDRRPFSQEVAAVE